MRRSMPEKFRSYLTLFDWCKSGVINVYVARFLPSDQRSSAPISDSFRFPDHSITRSRAITFARLFDFAH
jgi:hypothetical protein